MYKEPFVILVEKVPFLEYLVRIFQLFIKPAVEQESDFPNGKLKYALWDIFLSASLFSILNILMAIFTSDISFNTLITVFKDPVFVYLNFGYKAYCVVLSFFICSAVVTKIFKKAKWLKISYLSALHLARVLSVMMVITFSILTLCLYLIFIKLITLKDYLDVNSFVGISILFIVIIFLIMCCIRPLNKCLRLCNNSVVSYLIVLTMLTISVPIANLVPDMSPLIKADTEKIMEVFKQNRKYKSLSPEKKLLFDKQMSETLKSLK